MQRTIPAIFVFFLASCTIADEWKSPDGTISVSTPDQSRFVALIGDARLAVDWVSKDQTVRLAVSEISFASHKTLARSSLKAGLADSMNGKIVASSVHQVAGHDVFTMTCRGNVNGNVVYTTQRIVHIGSKAYKVLATGIGDDVRRDTDALEFLNSINIHVPKESSRVPESEMPIEDENQLDRDAYALGRLEGLMFLAGVTAFLITFVVFAILFQKSRS